MKSIDRLVTGLASELNIDSGARNQARRAWHYLATDTGNLYEILEDNVTLIGTLTLNAPAVYVALLTQTGTNAPVATILQNTLGYVPTIAYDDVGQYIISLDAATDSNKLWYTISQAISSTGFFTMFDGGTGNVFITSSDTGAQANDLLFLTPIEIRVYP